MLNYMSTNYINDLKLKEEIFPIFNYCLNDLSKYKLYNLLDTPLKNIEDIYIRQNIIKGFILNSNLLKDYKYSKIYFHQVYEFLLNFSDEDLDISKTSLFFSLKLKSEIQSKFIQIINIFNKIEFFLKKINLDQYPVVYRKEILTMLNFISYFNLKSFKNNNLNILVSLSKKIRDKKDEFKHFFDLLIQFEVYMSLSISIMNNNFVFPTFSKKDINLEGLYHPLLKDPISNNIIFNKNVIILTGPNMSGKSTFLKSIFISIYLGHLGLGIPAKKASYPFFDYFSISLNSNDDLKKGYSHFMNEIILLKNSLINANKGMKCFIVFDEIFNGTNIDDAFKISSQTIKGLLGFTNCFSIISTHIQILNQIDEIKNNNTDNYYIDSSLIDKQPIFSYKLKKGWSDLKIGAILFEKEGIKALLEKNS
ncbi:MutS-related protein [Chishuiella sp.]|uniref:MutS-related protein n=1 Tax=Chishuiella sp. TaxID=1969467 RepID=UPI0028AD52E9|nr:hypothetical protein [Chishuiella sp.]